MLNIISQASKFRPPIYPRIFQKLKIFRVIYYFFYFFIFYGFI